MSLFLVWFLYLIVVVLLLLICVVVFVKVFMILVFNLLWNNILGYELIFFS